MIVRALSILWCIVVLNACFFRSGSLTDDPKGSLAGSTSVPNTITGKVMDVFIHPMAGDSVFLYKNSDISKVYRKSVIDSRGDFKFSGLDFDLYEIRIKGYTFNGIWQNVELTKENPKREDLDVPVDVVREISLYLFDQNLDKVQYYHSEISESDSSMYLYPYIAYTHGDVDKIKQNVILKKMISGQHITEIYEVTEGGMLVPQESAMKSEDSYALCSDEYDNDGDGFLNCDDEDCAGLVYCHAITDQKAAPLYSLDSSTVEGIKVPPGYGYCNVTPDCVAVETSCTDPCEITAINSGAHGVFREVFNEYCFGSTSNPQSCDELELSINCVMNECIVTILDGDGVENTDDACSDGYDNDIDFMVDCDDADCKNTDVCFVFQAENSAILCSDSLDNDKNGYVDCADEGCKQLKLCEDYESEDTYLKCIDEVDNNEDMLVDCDDPLCEPLKLCSGIDYAEKNDLTISGKAGENTLAHCTDRVDNDEDGLVDCEEKECVHWIDCQ